MFSKEHILDIYDLHNLDLKNGSLCSIPPDFKKWGLI